MREFWGVFPQVLVLLMEPQSVLQPRLQDLAMSVSGSDVLAAAFSDQAGEVFFVLRESNSGIRIGAAATETISNSCMALSAILTERPQFSPNFLKLNLQGHELAAMRGAGHTLRASR